MKATKRKFKSYACVLISTVTLFIAGSVAFGQAGSFRGDNQNSGFYNSDNGNFTYTKWKFKTQGMIFSTPLVSGNKLYVGSDDGYLYALEKQTGQVAWKFETGAAIPSSPAISDSIVYFLSMDGKMYANHVVTGAALWSFATDGEYKRQVKGFLGRLPDDSFSPEYWDFYLSSPLVVDSLLYFGSSDSSVYALNSLTGELVWRTATGHGNHSTPAYYNNKVYCGSWDSKLYAFDALTGDTIWTYQTGLDDRQHLMTGIQASPSVSDGVVYITSRDAKCYALNAETGELVWKSNFGSSWLPSSPSFDDSFLYFGSSDAMKLFCVDKKTGQTKYKQAADYYSFSSPAITTDKLYEGLFNGRLQTLDKTSGYLLSEFQNALSIKNHLGLQHGDGSFNITPMYDGIDYKYVIADSIYLSRIFRLGSLVSSPVTENGVVYITSTDSCIYALQSTQLEHSDTIDLGTVYEDSIVPVYVEFSTSEVAYDSVTIAVKSKSDKFISSIKNIAALTSLKADEKLTVSAELHAGAYSNGNRRLPLYLDFWQNGDRHRAMVELKFEVEAYIDSSNTDPVAVSNILASEEFGIECYPNPSNADVAITLALPESNKVEISVLNTAGSVVYYDRIKYSIAEKKEYILGKKLHGGLYTVIVKGAEWQFAKKVIIED